MSSRPRTLDAPANLKGRLMAIRRTRAAARLAAAVKAGTWIAIFAALAVVVNAAVGSIR